jgi:hypothetical protein
MKFSSFAIAAALVLTAAPSLAQDAAPEPERYPPWSVRPKLIGSGLALTAIAYGVGIVAATSWPDAPGADALKIPVAGPWIALAQNRCTAEREEDCADEVWLRGILTGVGGVVQLAGLALVTEAIVMKTEAAPAKPAETKAFVMPYPIVSSHSVGLGFVGTF